MDYYLDILLNPKKEMPLNKLLSNMYTNFHKALCDLGTNSVGISFPKYDLTLGNVMRIHGGIAILNDLQNLRWICSMGCYCSISNLTPVPSVAKFRTLSRKQPTMSQAKLRRLMKRGSIPENQIKQYKPKMFTRGINNPYVELISHSNKQKHRRYIEFGTLLDRPVPGVFDQFGLSKTATIPWFD